MPYWLISFLLGTRILLGGPVTADYRPLAQQTMDLNIRYRTPSVNTVMKENILLTLAYMNNAEMTPAEAADIINNPLYISLTLQKGKTFAFHDTTLPKYAGKIADTTHAHFIGKEGFKSDGYLFGDGVCHLASLMNMAARKAGLIVEAPTAHDFADIPGIPKKYGVSIYTTPLNPAKSARENLYITNPYGEDVKIVLRADTDIVKILILKQSEKNFPASDG